MKLTKNQKNVLADIFGNLAVAWISIGTISQVVFKMESLSMSIISFVLFLIFVYFAVIIVK